MNDDDDDDVDDDDGDGDGNDDDLGWWVGAGAKFIMLVILHHLIPKTILFADSNCFYLSSLVLSWARSQRLLFLSNLSNHHHNDHDYHDWHLIQK